MTDSNTSPKDQNDFAIGAIVFDRFRILEPIASGAKGRVYRAVDTVLDTEVALKVMIADSRNERDLVRFQSEAKLASKMHHQNIAQINDFGLYNDMPFLSMEFVEGESLDQILKKQNTLTIPEFLEVFFQVCDALVHAHKQSIVHRDIKPGNIAVSKMSDGSWKVKVLDFGIAKLLDERPEEAGKLTPTGNLVGSPFYMSPEQGQGVAVTTKSDNYSLGCVMWHCLTGAPPFVRETVMETVSAHISSAPPKLKGGRDHPLPANFEAVMEGLLSKDPTQRPDIQTAVIPALIELQDSLENEIEMRKALVKRDSEEETVSSASSSNRKRLVWICTSISVVVLIGVAINAVVAIFNQQEKALPAVSGPFTSREEWMVDTVAKASDQHTKNLLAGSLGEKTELTLRANCTYDDIKKLATNTTVRKVDFSENDFDDRCFPLIAKIPNLEALSLSHTHVTNLENVGLCKKLKWLEIKMTPITDESLKNLGSVKKLEALRLNDTAIGDNGIGMLVKVRPELRDLDITGTEVTSAVADSLTQLKNVVRLVLNRTNIDEAAARKILSIPTLSDADFAKCQKISPVVLARLRTEFPTVTFGDLASVQTELREQINAAAAIGDNPKVLKLSLRLLDLLRQRFGEKDNGLVSAMLAEVGVAYGRLGDIRTELVYFERSIAIARRMNDALWLRDLLSSRFNVMLQLHNYKDAEVSMLEALKNDEVAYGPNSKWALEQSISLGGCYRLQKQTDKAIATFERVVAICKKRHEEMTRDYFVALTNLGETYRSEQKYDLAYAKLKIITDHMKAHPELWKDDTGNRMAIGVFSAFAQTEYSLNKLKDALASSAVAVSRLNASKLAPLDRSNVLAQHASLLIVDGQKERAARFRKLADDALEQFKREEAMKQQSQKVQSQKVQSQTVRSQKVQNQKVQNPGELGTPNVSADDGVAPAK